MNTHPTQAQLALLAGGDCSSVSTFLLNRHVRQCDQCLDTIAEFVMLRQDTSADLPNLAWDRLEAEMKANIHLGLEAGECVRRPRPLGIWNPRLAVAFASLMLLLGAGVWLRVPHSGAGALPLRQSVKTMVPSASAETPGAVLESSGSGLELRTGGSSLTLLNHHGSVADQTVSAQGVIRASYIDAGGVTINNVYLE